jgi:phosphatidylserine/phosphatidylglycerophosphate/cardiolipin synthase-like enzyme
MKNEKVELNWWNKKDYPVRNGTKVSYLIDGKSITLEMCISFFLAKKYIYIAHWALNSDFLLVREKYLKEKSYQNYLRERGLDEKDIQFWISNDLTIENVLHYCLNKGIKIKVLLWGTVKIPFVHHYNSDKTFEHLVKIGIPCIIDHSSNGFLHYRIQSLHQKSIIVDGYKAFIGSFDPVVMNHDFDRWDKPNHSITSSLRAHKAKSHPHPWHDLQAIIHGKAVMDIESNFKQRWNDVVKELNLKDLSLVNNSDEIVSIKSNSLVQIVRTIPRHTYKFATRNIKGIAYSYRHAFRNSRDYIYIENQYLWSKSYLGIDFPFIGTSSLEMKRNIRLIARALRHGVDVVIILPDNPNLGREFTDKSIKRLYRLYKRYKSRENNSQLSIFCLASSCLTKRRQIYRPIYVHAKVAIIDDIFTTVGSANLNSRGMRNDVEINVNVLDRDTAVNLRLQLWVEHLGILSAKELNLISDYNQQHLFNPIKKEAAIRILENLHTSLDNPHLGMQKMRECAENNLSRFKENKPLKGHLLPYFTQEEAFLGKLTFKVENHGWVRKG